MKNWKKIKTERVFDHKYFKVNKDLVELPDGRKIDWLYWDSADSAMIVPITPSGKLIMIRQFRYLPNQIALEFPSGHGNPNESIEECAKRELAEETGYECIGLIKLGEFFETMGQLNRKIHMFIGKNAVKIPGPVVSSDPNENIEIVQIKLDEAVKMVNEKKIISIGTSLAILLAKENLKKIVTESTLETL
ncbi:MAG: NUDIX hydrolase [Candidatus Berkelbacteria bacterium]|nr:NUDIX hydrolase [Candidatus Berkelbacteria bacterium]